MPIIQYKDVEFPGWKQAIVDKSIEIIRDLREYAGKTGVEFKITPYTVNRQRCYLYRLTCDGRSVERGQDQQDSVPPSTNSTVAKRSAHPCAIAAAQCFG